MGSNYISFFIIKIMTEEKKLFKTTNGEYDPTVLENNFMNNAEQYLNWRSQNSKDFDIENAKTGITEIAQGIISGDLSRGAGRLYYSASGKKYNPIGLDLLDRVLQSSKPIVQKEEKKEYPTLNKFFIDTFYGGNTPSDLSLWGNGGRTIEDLKTFLTEYKKVADPILHTKIDKLSNNLADNNYDNTDTADWVALGGDELFFNTITGRKPIQLSPLEIAWKQEEDKYRLAGLTPQEIAEEKKNFMESKLWKNSPEGKSFYEQQAAKLYQQQAEEFISKNWLEKGQRNYADLGISDFDKNIENIWNGEGTTESWIERLGNSIYAEELFKNALNGVFDGIQEKDGLSNSQILRLYIKDQFTNDPDQFTRIGNTDEYFINESIDVYKGSGVKYNVKTNKLTKVFVDPTATPTLLGLLKKKYKETFPLTSLHTTGYGSFLKGGGKLASLKALRNGGNIQYALSGAELAALKKKEREAKYNQSVMERAAKTGLTEEEVKLGDVKASEDNSFNSDLRNLSTALDVIGGVASFIPVIGNAAGATIGTVGTIGNLVADALDDSVSSEEMWTNLTLNVALTGLMLIPGGGTASLASKALKVGKTAIQIGAPAYAGYQVLSNKDRIKELLKKQDDGTLTHSEERELNMYWSMAAGSVTGIKGASAHAAKHLGNNVAGKFAAGVADPITGVAKLLGNKKASRVIDDMVTNTKPVTVREVTTPKGKEFEILDVDGNPVKVTAKQRKAMLDAEATGRKNGLTGDELNEVIGEAWAKSADTPKSYTTTIKRETPVKWNIDSDKNIKDWLATKTTPSGDVESGGIKFSKESVQRLQEAYAKASESVDGDEVAKHTAGLKAAKDLFETLNESKQVSEVTEILAGMPKFNINDPYAGVTGKVNQKLGVNKSGLEFKDIGSSRVERYLNSGEGYRFDPHTNVGRANIAARVRQRKHAQDLLKSLYLDKFGTDWLLRNFNTNWELGQNMSGFRTRTDDILDRAYIHKRERSAYMNNPANSDIIALNSFRYTPDGIDVLKDLEVTLGRKATQQEQIDAMNAHFDKLALEEQNLYKKLARANDKQKANQINLKREIKVSKELIPELSKLSDDDIISYYQVAKINGFQGTMSQYYESLSQNLQSKKNRIVSLSNTFRSQQNKAALVLVEQLKPEGSNLDMSKLITIAKSNGYSGSNFKILQDLMELKINSPKDFNKLLKQIPSSKQGSKLETIKALRRNFNTDTLEKLSTGGILKGEGGVQIPDWYKNRYQNHTLLQWNPTLDDSDAGILRNSKLRGTSGDISQAYRYNDAYINSENIQKDIQNYYNKAGIQDPSQFVNDYNNKIRIIDSRWSSPVTYKQTGAREGNLAFKDLFSSANDKNAIYYLGYNPEIDDIYGSTSWLRRADKYEKELSDLTDEELRTRTHSIIDSSGNSFNVYKNADGTLTLTLPTRDAITKSNSEDPSQGEPVSTSVEENTRGQRGDGGGFSDTPSNFNSDEIEYQINQSIPEVFSAARLYKNLRNNQRLADLAKSKRVAYLSPIIGHENVYGDFSSLMQGNKYANDIMSQAYRASGLYNNPEAAFAMLLDSQLKANQAEASGKQIDDQTIAKSAKESELAEKQRYQYNHKVGDENSGRSVAKINQDIDVEMGKESANTTNWNTWFMEQEQRARQRNLTQEEKAHKLAMFDFDKWEKDNITNTPQLQMLREKYAITGDTKVLNEIKKVQAENQKTFASERFQRLRDIMVGKYFNKYKSSSTFVPVMEYAKGGKVDNSKVKRRAEDLKELRKQIRHSITTNQKALDNLSKATLLELKKMMGI